MADGPVHYKAVDLGTLEFGAMERDGKLYSVRLQPKAVIQTPLVKLTSPLVDSDGELLTFAHVAPPPAFVSFFRRAEAAILDACLANKLEWFKKDLDDDVLRTGFKSFLKPNGTIKLKVPEDVAAFDAARTPVAPGDVAPGTQVRCILELAKISFGKTEFGASWKLVQIQAAATPPCLIDDSVDAPEDDDDDFL